MRPGGKHFMNIFLETKRPSVKCHRRKHEECKNKSLTCGCECHIVKQKNIDIQNSNDLQVLDEYICGCWREFWRPFLPWAMTQSIWYVKTVTSQWWTKTLRNISRRNTLTELILVWPCKRCHTKLTEKDYLITRKYCAKCKEDIKKIKNRNVYRKKLGLREYEKLQINLVKNWIYWGVRRWTVFSVVNHLM